MITTPWEFVLQPQGSGFNLFVRAQGSVLAPVGPRLERGEPVPDKYLRTFYPDAAEAFKAKTFWESYFTRVVSQVKSKKAKRK